MLRFVFRTLFLFFCGGYVCSQSFVNLPLARDLRQTFPNVISTYYRVVNNKSGLVLYESKTSPLSFEQITYSFKNKYGEEFEVSLSGANDQSSLKEDEEKINQWLDQFFAIKISYKNEQLVEIPVIYGLNVKKIKMVIPRDLFVILSDKKRNKVTKTVLFRTMMEAPLKETTKLGAIQVSTQTFEQPIIFEIFSNEQVSKNVFWENIIDSLKYLLFGRVF